MRALTQDDKRAAFMLAVSRVQGWYERWNERQATGLDDHDLEAALFYEMGIESGTYGRAGKPNMHCKAAGLKIWASWGYPNPHKSEPIFEGKATLRAARVYLDIRDPDEKQLELFAA